jgi:predicted methyltransferase
MRLILATGLALALQAALAPAAISAPASISKAVGSADRLPADVARDANRKPAQTLAFFKIKPGQTVLDVFSGGGYFTELAARAVGPKGQVTAYSPPVYKQFAGKDIAAHDYARRLPNVTELWAEANDADFGENKYDRILLIQGYHDLYLPDGEGWPKIDAEKFRQKLYKALKPGGILGIVDHVAVAGAPRDETAQKIHRIDPSLIVTELEASGFKNSAVGAFLRNSADDHTLGVFDPKIRGRTDQVIMRFSKRK